MGCWSKVSKKSIHARVLGFSAIKTVMKLSSKVIYLIATEEIYS